MIWIGVAAHTRLHEAVALGPAGVQTHKTVPNTSEGWASLLAWAAPWGALGGARVGDRGFRGAGARAGAVSRGVRGARA